MTDTMPRRCETCRHWQKIPPTAPVYRLEPWRGSHLWGECVQSKSFEGAPYRPDTTAVALDGYAPTSDYTPHVADFGTRSDHGCTMHEPKETHT